MKLGIVADIHEDVRQLGLALQRFRREGVDQVVLLGDVFDTGRQLRETIALLAESKVIGVWGNHDLGLCHEPEEEIKERYAGPVLDFMQTLRPWLELETCWFSHGLPSWDPTDPAVYYLGARPETAEGRERSFAASSHSVLFVGHFHRWLAATPGERLTWDGAVPLLLPADQRHLVVVAAVCDGWCAVFDTGSRELRPCQVGAATGTDLPGRK